MTRDLQQHESETAPLLREHQLDPPPSGWRWSLFQARSPRAIVLLLSIAVFFISAGSTFANVPIMRILEDNICRRYYGDVLLRRDSPPPIDEKLCKIDEIQSELAYLIGLLLTLEAVIGLVVAFPFGVLADSVGRKPIFVLSITGSLLAMAWALVVLWLPQSIPVHWILVGPAFNVVGGGGGVVVAVLYSIISDVVSDADRASAFFLMAFASLLGTFVGPPIASKLMEAFSPWLPTLLTFAVIPIGVSMIAFIPETLPLVKQRSHHHGESDDEPQPSGFLFHLSHTFIRIKDSLAMLKSPSLLLVLASYLVRVPENLATSQFFAQYISKRFGWSLAGAGYLLTIRGLVTMAVLLVILPWLSKLLMAGHQHDPGAATTKDLVLARYSTLVAVLGALLMAAPDINVAIAGLTTQTLAAGLGPLCRSLAAAYLVEAGDTSKLYTLISIVETVGMMYAGPALAWSFAVGMRLKGVWLGLPYFGLAGAFVLCLVALMFVKVPVAGEIAHAGDGDSEERGEPEALS